MKKLWGIYCDTVISNLYEFEKDGSLSTLTQIRTWFHLLFCPGCAAELKKIQCVDEMMKNDFFPPVPHFEESIMQTINEESEMEEKIDAPTGFSFRGWVFIGFFMLLSLSSVFFGMNFIEIANNAGLSFLLPIGLTIGIILTCYGAFFIGSHLNELSMRFRLR